MLDVPLHSMEQLIEQLNQLGNSFVYRGQSNAEWRLESTLERVIGTAWSGENAAKFEKLSLLRFQSKYHLYDRESHLPNSKLGWLAVMQHHGVPTRLLDFTESPYVGLYFALESFQPANMQQFAIFAIDYSQLMERSLELLRQHHVGFEETQQSIVGRQDEIFEDFVDKSACDVAWVAEPGVFNSRLDRQSGSFVLSGNRSLRIEELLARPDYEGVTINKFSMPASLYPSCFRLLQKMNINSKSLYGDVDGLARSIRMELQVYAV